MAKGIIYLISPLANKEESEKYCFKECGKIIVGGIDFMDAPWLPCREQLCPYEDKHLSMGVGEIQGEKEHIIVRKLRGLND